MKTLLSYTMLFAIVSFLMSASPRNKSTLDTNVTIFTANGTAYNGSLQISSGTYLNSIMHPEDYETAGQTNIGWHTVTITSQASGTHTYSFTGGYSKTTSTGSATFTNVNITANSTASIY